MKFLQIIRVTAIIMSIHACNNKSSSLGKANNANSNLLRHQKVNDNIHEPSYIKYQVLINTCTTTNTDNPKSR